MEAVLFFAAAIGALGGAIGVVALRNPFYGVLSLIVHLFSLAILFLLLSAAFVAAAQVVVYAGAVMVLYVFVVAYVGSGESAWESIPGQQFLAPVLGIAVFLELSIAVLGSSLTALGSDGPDVEPGFGDPAAIGHLLLEDFLLAFEAASILLLLAAVGAVVLAGRREGGAPAERSAPKARSEGVSPSR